MRKLLLLFALMICFAATAADYPTALRVTNTSGDAMTFLFETQPELQMSAKRFTVKSTAHPAGVTFDFDNVEAIDFITAPTSLEDTPEQGIVMTMANGTLFFTNVPENSPVTVYTTDGRQVLADNASGEFSINIADMPRGIYIVRLANFATKVSF